MEPSAGNPAVAVVTVIRNQERWVDACAESVLTQTGLPLEWIVVDNASDDGTRERLRVWAGRDARVQLQLADENLKQAEGLVRALQFVRAPWIAMLDGDDVALPDRLTKSLDWLSHDPQRVAVYGNAQFIDETGAGVAPWFIARDAGALRRMAEFTMPAIHSTSAWRSDWLRRGIMPVLRRTMAFDYLLLTRALAAGEVGWLPQALSAYRVHAASESHRNATGQLADGMAISMAAARSRAGHPANLEELSAWAVTQTGAAASVAELHTAAARRAWSESLPRHALYYARRALRRGQVTALVTVLRVITGAASSRHDLWPIMRGGLLAAARVDGSGRSLPGA